jgi:hypothetical protein
MSRTIRGILLEVRNRGARRALSEGEARCMSCALAVTYHDPRGQLYDHLTQALPLLGGIFGHLVVQASAAAPEPSLDLLRAAGAHVHRRPPEEDGAVELGWVRRAAVGHALELAAPTILYCDCDRILHWVTHYPDELRRVALQVAAHDCTVLGRTQRAFDSHPRVQRDTEAIVNHVFGLVSGAAWDVTAAARGLSSRAARAIVEGCDDHGISVDVSWPLFLQRAGTFTLAYIATDGLAYETADRYHADVTAAGGRDRWIARLDADPRQWADRLNLAHREVEAMLPYWQLDR